jgi:RNA polymerase sigma factor (sigma-70 family)
MNPIEDRRLRSARRAVFIQRHGRQILRGAQMILNEFLSWRRRSWRLVPASDAGQAPASATPDHADASAERAGLLAELAKLPRRQRAVLVLRYYEDRRDAEIAELLGCTAGTVRYASRAPPAAARPHPHRGQGRSPPPPGQPR